MANVSSSECQVCGMQLSGKEPVRVGDQVFCSKACADQVAQQREQPPEPPKKE